MTTVDVYQEITDKVIGQLDKGTVPWRMPFHTVWGTHRNLQSSRQYRGINQLLLALTARGDGYEQPYWTTFNAMKKAGGTLSSDDPARRRSTMVTLWKTTSSKCKEGFPHTPDHACHGTGKVTYRLLRYYYVFNVEQTTLESPVLEDGDIFDPDMMGEGMCDGYIVRSGVTMRDTDLTGAYYAPSLDVVNVPPRKQFDTMEGYYSTWLHELAHSTGHRDRLARKGIMERTVFGDGDYSDEELVAEFTASMCMGILGLFNEDRLAASAGYIESWRSKLEDDPRLVVYAAARAQKAADFIIGKTWDNDEAVTA